MKLYGVKVKSVIYRTSVTRRSNLGWKDKESSSVESYRADVNSEKEIIR